MPTALELRPEEREKYRETARRRALEPRMTDEDEQERQRLLQALSAVADVLRSKYGIKRVVVFGSLAHGAWFSAQSDVDLALEGAGRNYWTAWDEVETAVRGRSVDVVELETASASLCDAIER